MAAEATAAAAAPAEPTPFVPLDIDVRNKWGETPLHVAINAANVDVAILLMKSGASVNLRCNRGEAAIDKAARIMHDQSDRLMEAILDHNPELTEREATLFLFDSIRSGSTSLVRRFILRGADPNYWSIPKHGGITYMPALYNLSEYMNLGPSLQEFEDMVRCLLQNGADPELIPDGYRWKWYDSIKPGEYRSIAIRLSGIKWTPRTHGDFGPFCHSTMATFLMAVSRLTRDGRLPHLDPCLIEETFENVSMGDIPFSRESLPYTPGKRKA